MKHRVFVDGQEGTTGLRIHDYLAGRGDIEVLRIDADKRKDRAERARLLNAADVAFLCLPDEASREAAALVDNPNTCVIDASTAFRTAPDWAFGLPELAPDQRSKLRAAKRISNPGCHASAFILLVRPLVDAGVIPATLPLSATSLTGYSGGGKKMIDQYQTSDDPRLDAPRPYGLTLTHKHIPEMTVHCGLAVAPVFLPVVGKFYKGLTVSVPLTLSELGVHAHEPRAEITAERVFQVLKTRYQDERFINVLPLCDAATLEAGYFDVQANNDTNRVDLFVFANATQVLLMARLDNLGKGASGAAVQTINVHLGLDEALGL